MAILGKVSRLNIIGAVNARRLSPSTRYAAYFVSQVYGCDGRVERVPVNVGVIFGNQPAGARTAYLKTLVPMIREDGRWGILPQPQE